MAEVDPVVVASAEKAIEHKVPLVANLPWRARVAIVAMIIVIIVLLVQAGNQSVANGKLQRSNNEQLEKISQQRTAEISNLAVLLQLVQKLEDRAKAQGETPAVTVESAVEALKKSGFGQDILNEAVRLSKGQQGPPGKTGQTGAPGPQGQTGPAGKSTPATTSSTAQATTTSTTRPPTTTTSSTTTTKPCAVALIGLKLGC